MNYQDFVNELTKVFTKCFGMNVKYMIGEPCEKLLLTIKHEDSYNKLTITFDENKESYFITARTIISIIDEEENHKTINDIRVTTVSDRYNFNFDTENIIKIKMLVLKMFNENMLKVKKDLKKFISVYNNINLKSC